MQEFDRKYRHIAFWLMVAIVVIIAAMMLHPFLPALLWSVVLTVLTRPVYDWLRKRFSPNGAAIFTTFGTLAVIGVPLALVGGVLFVQVNGFLRELHGNAPPGQSLIDPVYLAGELDRMLGPTVKNFSPTFTFTDWFLENRTGITRAVAGPAGKIAIGAGTAAFQFVVAFLTMFFLLRDGHRMKEPAMQLIPLPKERSEDVFDKLGRTIHAVFISVVLVGIVQGVLAGIAYAVAGVPNALMWCVATIVLCMIPLLGAPIIYIPMSLILMAQGKVLNGVLLLVFCLGIVSNIDNFIKPWVIGSRVDLHPMAVFFALLGGIFFFGPVGLMAGPMVLTLLLAVNDILQERRKVAADMGFGDEVPI